MGKLYQIDRIVYIQPTIDLAVSHDGMEHAFGFLLEAGFNYGSTTYKFLLTLMADILNYMSIQLGPLGL